MKTEHTSGGSDRHPAHRQEGRGRHHPRGRRPFDYGDLRLLVLGMISERPRHGYEIMKAIEEQTGGSYSPSPGVIYPTLAWLEDMGYAVATVEAGRKSFSLTGEGEAFLAANQTALSGIAARLGAPGRRDLPEPIMEAMGGLRHAIRSRVQRGPMDADTVAAIAAALHTATQTVETSMTEGEVRLRSVALVQTPKAAGYLQQLCKHFAHKLPVTFDETTGRIGFSRGDCLLSVEGEVLSLTVETSDPEAIPVLEDVVARHLARFAFREELVIDWKPA